MVAVRCVTVSGDYCSRVNGWKLALDIAQYLVGIEGFGRKSRIVEPVKGSLC